MKNHVVNRVSIRLPASDYENARNMQKDAQNWSSHYLPDILEKSFDEFSNNGEFYFIDKIEIELTKFPWQLSESEWKQKIAETISGKRISKLPVEIILKQWIFYLINGCFERNSVISKIGEIEKYFLEVNLKLSDAELRLLSRVFTSETTIKRLFFNHSAQFLYLIIAQYFKLDDNNSEQLYKVVKFRLIHQPTKIFEFIKKLNHFTMQKRWDLKEKMVERILQNPDNSIIEESTASEIIPGKESENEEDIIDSSVSLHCANAGLVILLPFIKSFFVNLGLVENDSFIDGSAKNKACNVLHFLATGKVVEDEPDLLLPKILCGFEISEFVETMDFMEESIESEVVDLLNSVIEHWDVLKNTSVESLRETFLQRDGQLKIESAFLLQVSNSGVDILLGKIPWGFHNYKLPWMQKSLITEWH